MRKSHRLWIEHPEGLNLRADRPCQYMRRVTHGIFLWRVYHIRWRCVDVEMGELSCPTKSSTFSYVLFTS